MNSRSSGLTTRNTSTAIATIHTQNDLSRCRHRWPSIARLPAMGSGAEGNEWSVIAMRAPSSSDAERVAELLLHLRDSLGDFVFGGPHDLDGFQRLRADAGLDALHYRQRMRLHLHFG